MKGGSTFRKDLYFFEWYGIYNKLLEERGFS
jgi:hypothetical protein